MNAKFWGLETRRKRLKTLATSGIGGSPLPAAPRLLQRVPYRAKYKNPIEWNALISNASLQQRAPYCWRAEMTPANNPAPLTWSCTTDRQQTSREQVQQLHGAGGSEWARSGRNTSPAFGLFLCQVLSVISAAVVIVAFVMQHGPDEKEKDHSATGRPKHAPPHSNIPIVDSIHCQSTNTWNLLLMTSTVHYFVLVFTSEQLRLNDFNSVQVHFIYLVRHKPHSIIMANTLVTVESKQKNICLDQ